MSVYKQHFVRECERQLTVYFQKLKQHQLNIEEKSRIQGFMKAGEFLGLLSYDEAIELIDTVHFQVFDMTKEQRKSHKETIKSVLHQESDNFFDIPAITRHKMAKANT